MAALRALRAATVRPLGLAGLAGLLLWLLVGDLGVSMRDRAALPGALELLRRHEASDTVTSLLLATLPAALSMLLVPLAGYHSDHCRSRLGRRRPFLLVAAPVGGLALVGVALSPSLAAPLHDALGSHSPGLAACRLLLFGLCWAVFDCAAISALSLFNGLVNDLVPPRLLGRFFAGFRVVGLGAGIAFHHWVFALTDQHLGPVLIGVALCFALPLVAMVLALKEAPLPPEPATAAEGRPPPWRFPLAHVLACFRYRPFGWAVAVFMLAGATFGPFNTFYLHYAHALGLGKSTLGTLTAAGYAVSLLSAFGIGWLVDRHGAARVSSVVMGLYCGLSALGFAGVSDATSFQVYYLAHVILSGAWFTAAASLPMALFPRSRFVQFNSTKDLMAVLGAIVVSGIQGPALDLSGHDYRFTILAGSLCSLLAVACLVRLQAGDLGPAAALSDAAPAQAPTGHGTPAS